MRELTTREQQRLLHHRLVELGIVGAKTFDDDDANSRLWVLGYIVPMEPAQPQRGAPVPYQVTPQGVAALGIEDVLARVAAIALRLADHWTLPESMPGTFDTGRALMAWRALRSTLDELRKGGAR